MQEKESCSFLFERDQSLLLAKVQEDSPETMEVSES